MDYGVSDGLNARLNLAETWGPLCAALGIPASEVLPEEMLLVGGMLLRDKAVTKLRMDPEYQYQESGTCVFSTNWPKLFRALGPAGCAELRQRVKRVCSK